VYTFESENEAGCTNTATLNLTINSSTTSEETATACDSYTWNGTEYTTSGVYTFESENGAGCINTATLNLTINAKPEATITGNVELTCATTEITLDASGTSVQGTPSYVWNTGATTPTIVVTAPGEYSVIVTGSDNGCSATATTTVTQNTTPLVVIISGNEELTCNVTSITLDAGGTTVQGTATYLWNTGETTSSIEVDETGDYTVAVTDSYSGCSGALTISVTENYTPAEISGGSSSLCIEDVNLDLTTLLGSDFVSGGTWTDDLNSEGLTGNTFNPSIVNLGDYQFTYTEPGDCGRIITVSVNVNDDCVVLACSTEDMIISKVVTPNNDGFNDNFEIIGLEDCDFTFGVKIFNRWGKIVYQSDNYLNNWNGKNDGSGIQIGSNNDLPTGTYYYIVTVSGGTGFKPITGYIYLGTH
uniref:gliding motility-associated C-terminal domain-containing protein n=1 Tax=Lutibacter sp. TaxID=1925666 RepID=UPI003567E496